MGLFRRKNERAIAKPGSKEFDEAVRGGAAANPGSEQAPPPEPSIERPEPTEQPEAAAEDRPAGEPDQPDEPTRRKKVLGSLGRSILKPPNAEGFGGGIPGPQKKRKPES